MNKLLILLILCLQHLYGQINNNKKILIVATSADNLLSKPSDHSWGAYAPEISEFYSAFYKAGFRAKDLDIVTLKGGPVPIAMPTHYPKKFGVDEQDRKLFEEKLKHALSPSQVNTADYNVVYYSGGFSCLVDYPSADSIATLAARIYEAGGIIGAVCDGIAGLIPIRLSSQDFVVANKTITTNGHKNKTDSISRRLIRQGASVSSEVLVNDKRLVTAHGVRPVTVAEEILRMLGYPITRP